MDMRLNEKSIASVWWPDTEVERGRHIDSGPMIKIEMSAAFHGDRNEFWIVEYRKDIPDSDEFKEFARHNPRYVESIYWEKA